MLTNVESKSETGQTDLQILPQDGTESVESYNNDFSFSMFLYKKTAFCLGFSRFEKKLGSFQLPGYQPDTYLKIDKFTEFRLKKFRQKLEKEQKRKITLKETLNIMLDQVEQPYKPKSNRVGAQQQRELEAEHQGKCAIPNCNSPATELHHTKRYAKHQTHEGVVPLCHEHHQIAHAGLIANEYDPPTKWQFRKQMRPDSIDLKYLGHLAAATDP